MRYWNGLSAFLLITLLFILGSYRAYRVDTGQAYLFANRKIGLLALTATLVTPNLATLIAFSGVGYRAGWWAITLPAVFFIGLLFYAFSVAKGWKQFNGKSVACYFSERYGRDVGFLVAIILFIAMLGFSATYVKSLFLLFQPLFPHHSPWLMSGIGVAAILLMTWRGGLIAIIHTDLANLVLLLLFFPLLFYFTYRLPVASETHMAWQQMTGVLPPRYVGSLLLLTMFSYILAPWYGQKMVAAKSPRIAYYAVILAALLVFVLYGLGVMAASLLKYKGTVLPNSEMVFPYLIHHALPASLQGIAYATLFIMAATSLGGVWSAMVTLLIGQFYQTTALSKLLYRSMVLMAVCALLSFAAANLFVDNILNKMVLANIPVVALSFSLLAGFHWRSVSRMGVYFSIFIGLAVGIGCYIIYGEKGLYTWYWAIYGIPLIFLSGVGGSLLPLLWHRD